jgi:hypothetical protein
MNAMSVNALTVILGCKAAAGAAGVVLDGRDDFPLEAPHAASLDSGSRICSNLRIVCACIWVCSEESGCCYALDIGGTNFRVVYYKLSDKHGVVVRQAAAPTCQAAASAAEQKQRSCLNACMGGGSHCG